MATMQVDVVSAERRIFSGEASEVYARSLEGEIGVLPGHQPALLALDIAPVKIVLPDGDEQRVAVHNGFLYYRDGRLRILADTAELASEIDLKRAGRRQREVEGRIEDRDNAELQASMRRQELRMRLGG